MARPPSPGLTDAELRVMRVLWERKRATVGDVVERLAGTHTPAYNTVLTTLGILERKGYVTHEKDGRAFAYVPVVDQSEARHSALSQVLKRFFDDSPRLLVLDLLGHERTDADELRRVRELIEHAPPDTGDATRTAETPAMTLIVTWLWQGLAIAWITAAAVRAMPRLNAATRHAIWWLALAAVLAIPVAHGLAAIATGTPSAPDLTGALDAAGALMLPAIPDGVVACAVAIWAMTAAVGALRIARSCRALGRLKRASSPFDRSREARLPLWVAARDGGHRAAELRTSDWHDGSVRARPRPARHPRVAIRGRRGQRRVAGRDRDARAGASRSLRRLVTAAAGRRRQSRWTAPGRAIPRATDGCRPRGRVRRSRRVAHRGHAPLRLLPARGGCGVESESRWG